jgi:TPR repeat protein
MLKLISIFLSIFSILLLTACNGPGVNAYYRGNHAYEYGNYRMAFVNYLYAANQGVVPAQYAVGYQYFYGQGTKRDEPKGIIWLQRAAHHSPRAQYALHLIQEKTPRQPWALQLQQNLEKEERVHLPKICVVDVHCLH